MYPKRFEKTGERFAVRGTRDPDDARTCPRADADRGQRHAAAARRQHHAATARRRAVCAVQRVLLAGRVLVDRGPVSYTHLEEVFGTGTAAVISPVGELRYEDEVAHSNGGEIGEITHKLYNTLTGIQWGTLPDELGWTVKVD